MAKTETAVVRINKRTLRIGGQVYPLGQISRVQTMYFHPPKNRAWSKFFKAAAGLVVAAVVALCLAGSLAGNHPSLPTVIALAAFGWLAILVAMLVYRLVNKPKTLYGLTVETSGTQYTALSSYDLSAIQYLEGEVVAAIEDPPESERVLQIHNVVTGNQYNQSGQGSTMNVHP